MNDLRMDFIGSYGFKSPIQRWNDGDNIWGERIKFVGNLERCK